MTVHGAKGLEAPIVILADAATCHIKSKPVFIEGAPKPLLAYISSKNNHTGLTTRLLRQPDEDAQIAEYWRKLYVGMTRAEDELYISGYLNKTGKFEGTWYEAIEDALKSECTTVKIFGEAESALRFPAKIPPPLKINPEAEKTTIETPEPLPVPLAPVTEIQIVRASKAGTDAVNESEMLQNSIRGSVDADQAKREGSVLHDLLQYLADTGPEQRQKIADKSVQALLPGQSEAQQRLVAKALAILSGPDAELLFGPDSRAELPIFISGFKEGKPARLIGRIDRVIIKDGMVLVVDFKSNAAPPLRPEQVSMAYQMQLGLYLQAAMRLFPRFSPRAAIYWSANETLMYLDNKQLLDSTQNFNFTCIP